MKMKMKNNLKITSKQGAEKIMSVYWFIVLGIVAMGVFIMVYNFYNFPYDVREIEANIITNQIADCVSVGGRMTNVFSNSTKTLVEACNLNFETKEWEEIQYYVSLEIPNLYLFSEGNSNLISNCGIESEVEDKNLAKCVERSFYSLAPTGESVEIKILSIVRKTEKNVR